jgi:hypothetical protein
MKAANMSGPVLVGLQEELDKIKAAAKRGTFSDASRAACCLA